MFDAAKLAAAQGSAAKSRTEESAPPGTDPYAETSAAAADRAALDAASAALDDAVKGVALATAAQAGSVITGAASGGVGAALIVGAAAALAKSLSTLAAAEARHEAAVSAYRASHPGAWMQRLNAELHWAAAVAQARRDAAAAAPALVLPSAPPRTPAPPAPVHHLAPDLTFLQWLGAFFERLLR